MMTSQRALYLACSCALLAGVVLSDPVGFKLNAMDPAGCGEDQLTPGGDCHAEDMVTPGQILVYNFTIGEKIAGNGVLITIRLAAGVADMAVLDPDGQALQSRWARPPGGQLYNELFVRLGAADVKQGDYTIVVKARSVPSVVSYIWLRVETFAGSAKLAPGDAKALRGIMKKCCQSAYPFPDICETVLPATVGPNPRADLCQTGNFICNAQGRLLKLSLGFAGMSCPLPVEELSALDALQTITLDYNDFQGSSLDDLRQAIETASDLTRLFIRGANLTGALPCAFVESHPLKALFVGFNKVGGPLPGCYLKSTTLQEFSATNTRLTGTIPDVIPTGSQLRALRINNACPVPRGTPTDSSTTDGPSWKPCGPGLSGPLPSSLGNAGALKILDLSFHNQLTGGLPAGMPDSLEFMDLSYTGLGGNVAALPAKMVLADLSNASFSGPLPDLSASKALWALTARYNQFEGPLPSNLGGGNLVGLDLVGNKLSGPLEGANWKDLENLESLLLSNNQLTGTVPAALGALTELIQLTLRGNQLTGNLNDFAAAIQTLSTPDIKNRMTNMAEATTSKAGSSSTSSGTDSDSAGSSSGRRHRKLMQAGTADAVNTPAAGAAVAPAAAAPVAAAPVAVDVDPAPAAAAPAAAATPAAAAATPAAAAVEPAAAESTTAPGTTAAPADAVPIVNPVGPGATPTAADAGSGATPAPDAADATPAAADATPAAADATGAGGAPAAADAAAAPADAAAAPAEPAAAAGTGPIGRQGAAGGAGPNGADLTNVYDYNDHVPDPDITNYPNSITQLVLSDNQLTGGLPDGLANMIMWRNISVQLSPFVVFAVDGNQMTGELPGWLLSGILGCYVDQYCNGLFDLSGDNNTFYCPTADTIKAMGGDVTSKSALNISDALGGMTCKIPGKSEPVEIAKYLADPANYLTSLPAPPPPKEKVVTTPVSSTTAAASKQAPSRNVGMIVGIAVGVTVAVLAIAGLAAYLVRRRKTAGGALAYQKDAIPEHPVVDPMQAQAGLSRPVAM